VCDVLLKGDDGEITWICPACKQPDDGSPMIGCDVCDDWYHWSVFIDIHTHSPMIGCDVCDNWYHWSVFIQDGPKNLTS